ncbi:chromosome transmission fidelity protein 8 homolog [Rhopilema esculentum]|uniref:chromosome transmission fidelity protein 8 homolog n=1 Tax=Rhopilema esculentum TaxID=499914 RepID=UPI0031D6D737
MVQILVQMLGEYKEWGMVELQGALESQDDIGFNGLYIGDLHFDDKGIPNLIIGHHLLVGKVVELEKPFAVLKKNGKMQGMTNEIENSMDIDNQDKENEKSENKYEVVAFVKKKIIFKNRPRPIITNVTVKN